MTRAIGMAALVAGLLAAAAGSALAQDAIKAPASKSIGGTKSHEMVPSLAVLNARGATLAGGKLTLTGVGQNTIVFADRPVRAAGHVTTLEFVDEWAVGKDSFAKDPPNATISVFGADGKTVEDAVVVLKSPKLEGDQLTFDVTVLEGGISTAKGSAALFIDWFAVHGGGWGRGWHGAWYGHPGVVAGGVAAGAVAGAAIGAAAAAPYYRPYPYPYYAPPACGYYPYPPC